jgi:bacteriocin biosynthesis cyclodehydratase domain-containing protein
VLLLELLLPEQRRRRLSPTVPDRPLLAPWYRLVEDGDRLLLEHGRAVVVLEGGAVRTLLPALLPLLDGTRTRAELGGVLGSPAVPAVEQALELLAQHGLLVEGAPEAGTAGANAVAAGYGIAPAVAAERLRAARIGVLGNARLAGDIARLLRRAGLGVERLEWAPGRSIELAIVVPAPGEAGRVDDWNRLALEQGVRWICVRPFDGATATVGPLVVPGESACHACLLLRLAGHVDYAVDFPRIEAAATRAETGPALEAIVAGLTAQLALGWVAGYDRRLPGLLHVLESGPPLTLTAHRVLRVPRCPVCSTAERLAPRVPWHEAAA